MAQSGITIVALLLVLLAGVEPAHAQATRTWVSGVGDDANPCSRTAPCKTFAGAISKTAAGGEINAVDPGGFGAVTITKPITIDGGGTMASILAAGTNGVIINITASTPPQPFRVTLRNLSINGGITGLNGVRVLAAASVHIDNCTIFGFSGQAASAAVEVSQNAAFSFVSIRNSTLRNVAHGVNAHNTLPPPTGAGVFLDNVMVENATVAAVRAEGSGVGVFVNNSTLIGNGQAFQEVTGAVISSFGNNRILGGLGSATDLLPLR
jgi:hypothetical protein